MALMECKLSKTRLALWALGTGIAYLLLLYALGRMGVRKDLISSFYIAGSGIALVIDSHFPPGEWARRFSMAGLQAIVNFAVLFVFSRFGRRIGIIALILLCLGNIAAFLLAMNL